MLDVDGLAECSLDKRLSHLAILDDGIFYTHLLLHKARKRSSGDIHGGEVLHAITTVYVQHPASRAKAVCGIDIPTMLLVELQAPVAFVVLPEGLKIMDVSPLGTEYFAEEPLLCHVERSELEEVIHAVLKHHAVTLGALCGIDYIPGFLETGDSRHFAGDVLSLLHSIDHHRSVTSPVGRDVDEVDVGAVAERLPCFFAPRVDSCLGETCLL